VRRVRRRRRIAAAALLLAGAGLLSHGAYLPAKAATAQVLLQLAWMRSSQRPHRPWPWAKTWPVARLQVPRLGIDQIVLAGAEGAALAFGPGHVDGTAPPGAAGTIGLAGHRDTVFGFLRDLEIGDLLTLESQDRHRRSYRVTSTMVVEEHATGLLAARSRPTLTLVTCYPFETLLAGGPLRYVVVATEEPGGAAAQHTGTPGSDGHTAPQRQET
jgi:sortase A